jgi:hypothetical protein
MLKTDPRASGYISLKFFGHLLVEGHMVPMQIHLTRAISKFIPPWWRNFHSLIQWLDLISFSYIIYGGIQCFGASVLHTSLLSTHDIPQSSKLLKFCKLTTWLWPLGCWASLRYYIPEPSESRSLGFLEFWSSHQPRWPRRHISGTNMCYVPRSL